MKNIQIKSNLKKYVANLTGFTYMMAPRDQESSKFSTKIRVTQK